MAQQSPALAACRITTVHLIPTYTKQDLHTSVGLATRVEHGNTHSNVNFANPAKIAKSAQICEIQIGYDGSVALVNEHCGNMNLCSAVNCTLSAKHCTFQMGLCVPCGASLFLDHCKLIPNDADSAVVVLMDARKVLISNCIVSGCCGPGGCIRVVLPRTHDRRLLQSDSDRFVLLRCIENTFDNCNSEPFVERHPPSDDEELCWLRGMYIFKRNRYAVDGVSTNGGYICIDTLYHEFFNDQFMEYT